MSNEPVHPIFQVILGAMERNNIAAAKAIQQAEADARDAAQWRWLQDSIKQTGGVSIWPEVNGIQSLQWGVPTDCNDVETIKIPSGIFEIRRQREYTQVDEPMTAEGYKAIQDEMRADDDRAGLGF